MLKQIIKRTYEWTLMSSFLILVLLFIDIKYNIINWNLTIGLLLGYYICLMIKVPYNKEEIELDKFIDENNKNGFD